VTAVVAGYLLTMTEPTAPPDVIDDGTSDVMAEEEIVHVPAGAKELAESLEEPPTTFVAEVPHWDEPDPHEPLPESHEPLPGSHEPLPDSHEPLPDSHEPLPDSQT
jgi:hypothetical protein